MVSLLVFLVIACFCVARARILCLEEGDDLLTGFVERSPNRREFGTQISTLCVQIHTV